MLSSFVVYYFLLFFSYFFVLTTKRKESLFGKSGVDWPLLIVIIVLSIIAGGRYHVGSDWENYSDIFMSANRSSWGSFFEDSIEPLYLVINILISKVGLSLSCFFFIIEFLLIAVFCQSARDMKYAFPFLIFFFVTHFYLTSLNLVRQTLSITFFFLATYYFNKSHIKSIVFIVVAALFHYSSFVLLPFVFINSKFFKFLDNRFYVIPLFVISFFTVSIIDVGSIMPADLMELKYQRYANRYDEMMVIKSGYGLWATFLADFILLIYSKTIKEHFANQHIDALYRCFVVGIIFSHFMGTAMFLSRLVLGLVSLRLFLLGLTCYYLLRTKNSLHQLLVIMLLLYGFASFSMSILNGNNGCSPYQFLWQ